MIEHLLITRFNLRLPGWDADERARVSRTAAWEAERAVLFERYCLPSVLHQKERRFRWLLLLDEESGDELVRRVAAWRERMDRLEPVFLPPVRRGGIAAAVLERVDPAADVLVTTRLDNDDALHEDALAEVRRRVRPRRREFFNLRFGFATDGSGARVVSHKYSPFATFVEPRTAEGWRTVHCGLPHGRLRKMAPVRQIAERPLWLRVLHGGNLANEGFGEPRAYELSLRGLHARLRRRGRHLRRRFWPEALRREYAIEEIAAGFHLDTSAPATAPGETVDGDTGVA